MTTEEIKVLIQENKLYKFYKSRDWIKLKTSVLEEYHYECGECRKVGRITKYDYDKKGNKKPIQTVHHIKYVRDYPELAMTRTNLIPVCKSCHNKLHPEKRWRDITEHKEHFNNEEKW